MTPAYRESPTALMLGRTNWTRAMLERLRELHSHGLSDRNIADELSSEFGAPTKIGEVTAELTMLKIGYQPSQWNPAMEARIKEYAASGMDANDITTELFHEFAKPESGYWQETYRKMQDMKLKGDL